MEVGTTEQEQNNGQSQTLKLHPGEFAVHLFTWPLVTSVVTEKSFGSFELKYLPQKHIFFVTLIANTLNISVFSY